MSDSRAFQWTTLGITLALVVLRIYIRFPAKGTRGRFFNLSGLSDFLVVFAWLSYLDQACLDIVLSQKTSFFGDLWADDVPIDLRVLALKVWYAECITYLNCMYAVKASLLILYHQSLPSGYEHRRSFRRLLITVDGICACGWLMYFLMGLAGCRPVSRNWNPDPDEFCAYYKHTWYRGIAYGWHIATDVLVYLIPFFFIQSLQLPFSVKFGVGFTFLVGFLSIACAVATLVSFYMPIPGRKQFYVTHVEQTTAIIAGCLPALYPIITAWNNRRKMLPITQQDVGTKSEDKGGPAPVVVLAEARKHTDWMRGVVVQEHIARSEMASQAEDRVLKAAGMLSTTSSVVEHVTVVPSKRRGS